MIYKRIIACLTIRDGSVVQSIGFNKYLPVGNLSIAVENLNRWGIDEIAIIDIDASYRNKNPDFLLIKKSIKKNFAPLAVGGGIKTLEDMHQLNYLGAEKVIVNELTLINEGLVKKAAKVFGSQFVVASMDVKMVNKHNYEVFAKKGSKGTGREAVMHARRLEELGVGEILLNSIDADGSKAGFDIDLIKQVSDSVNIPVIACGGAGKADHFLQVARETNAAAIAAGNYFHFFEHSPILTKSFLLKKGVSIRLKTAANYNEAEIGDNGRLLKMSDDYLDKLRFEIIEEERI